MPDITGKWLHDELRDRGIIDDEHWHCITALRAMQFDGIAEDVKSACAAAIETVREQCNVEVTLASENERAARQDLAAANARIKALEAKLGGSAA